MTRLFPNGSFGRTHIRQIRRRRKNFMQRNLGQLQLDRARGANQANLTGMGHQALSQTKGSGPLRLRKHFHQNIHRDLHRLHACPLGNFALQKMDHLRQGEGQQQLLQDQHPFTGPPQVQTQRAFEQFEGHFDIPAPSIQACHMGQGQTCWIEHIGHILEKLLPVPVLHQTHQIRILVGAVDSQPDQRIQGVVLLIQDVLDLIARLGFEPGDPVVALIGEILEPLETKVAQVRQDQTARGQVLQQQERIERAIAKGIGKQLHMSPLLTTYIKDRRELAHQQTLTFLRQGPGLFTELGDRAQLTLIDGHDAGSEGGQPTGALVRRLAAQRVLNLPEQIRKRSQAQRQQALTNQLSASREQRNKRAKRFEQQGACDLGWREALSDHHEHTAQQQVSTLQGDWTPPADRRRAFWSRGGQEILEKLQELIDQRSRISGGRGRKWGMLWHRRESFLMEIVVLEWILFFFPCLDKSFFNLIVTDGWKLVPTPIPELSKQCVGERTPFPKLSTSGLVNDDLRIEVRIVVKPGCLVQLHIHAAVTAIAGEALIAAGVVVWELGAGTVVGAPPRIMDEETAVMVQNRVMDRRIGIPVGRALRLRRLEDRRRLAVLDGPVAGERWKFHAPGRHQEGFYQLPILIETQSLLNRRHHNHLSLLQIVVFEQLHIGRVYLRVGRMILIVGLQHMQVEDLIIDRTDHALEIVDCVAPRQFLVEQ